MTAERPLATLAAFAAVLSLTFGTAYALGRGFPDDPAEPAPPVDHTDVTHPTGGNEHTEHETDD